MGLLCSKSRIFSSPSPLTNPTITTAPPINWNLGNANEFKLLQLPLPQLVISARYADPTPSPTPTPSPLLFEPLFN